MVSDVTRGKLVGIGRDVVLVVQAVMLREQYGDLGTAVLAGMVSGKPWGLSGVPSEEDGCCHPLEGHTNWVHSPDYTAFG